MKSLVIELVIEILFYMFQTTVYSMCLIYSVFQLFQEVYTFGHQALKIHLHACRYANRKDE